MIKQSDVTIIIPLFLKTKEQAFAAKQCIYSLLETCNCPLILAVNDLDLEDEGQTVDLTEFESQIGDRIQLMFLTRQGQCGAVNAAVASCETPWVFVTNQDMIYAPGWFEKLVTHRREGQFSIDIEHLGGPVSPMLIEPQDGAPTFQKFFAGGAGGDFNKEAWLEFAKNHKGSGVRKGFNLPFLISRELWNIVDGYDIKYDPWGSNSDSDLEYKIRLAGEQPYQNTDCVVYHFSQISGTFEPKNRPSWEHNWKYFKEKWGFERTDDGIWTADFHLPTKEEGRIFLPWWENFFK